MVGGGGGSYRLRGGTFEPLELVKEIGALAQAFMADAAGGVYSVHRKPDGRTLVVSKLVGQAFTPQVEALVSVPHGQADVIFARLAPDGRIWVGLGYLDEEADHRPWGVVVLSPGAPPLYHRDSLLPTEDRQEGSLALPDDIRDVSFLDGDIWLATGSGACRVRGTSVDLFTENEEMASELVYAVTRATSGEILAATYAGVGRYDVKHWRFDLPGIKNTTSRALIADGDVLWIGTSKGLIRHAEGRSVGINTKHGLAGDMVLDLYLENSNRIWALTDRGLSAVSLRR